MNCSFSSTPVQVTKASEKILNWCSEDEINLAEASQLASRRRRIVQMNSFFLMFPLGLGNGVVFSL